MMCELKMYECDVCGKTIDAQFCPIACPNPHCPSNKKEETLVDAPVSFLCCRGDYDFPKLRDNLTRICKDAGEDGKIVGLTKVEISELINRTLVCGCMQCVSVRKKLEAK